jgi:ribonuclease P protein component
MAVARNRVRRLIREVFRKNRGLFEAVDVNVLGQEELTKRWKTLTYLEVEEQMLLLKKDIDGFK